MRGPKFFCRGSKSWLKLMMIFHKLVYGSLLIFLVGAQCVLTTGGSVQTKHCLGSELGVSSKKTTEWGQRILNFIGQFEAGQSSTWTLDQLTVHLLIYTIYLGWGQAVSRTIVKKNVPVLRSCIIFKIIVTSSIIIIIVCCCLFNNDCGGVLNYLIVLHHLLIILLDCFMIHLLILLYHKMVKEKRSVVLLSFDELDWTPIINNDDDDDEKIFSKTPKIFETSSYLSDNQVGSRVFEDCRLKCRRKLF